MIGNGVSKSSCREDVDIIDECIISLKHAYKSYDKRNYAVKNLSLSVPRGIIYSILGSSGSGKSSILSCIVGLTSLNSGSIHVNVNNRALVGYMPQDLALYEDLTIKETLNFFSILCNSSSRDVSKRISELIALLEIPTKNRLIKHLSGGQRRRVSLAVSMLNDPTLLVLDEPTVGLDSVLREKIWQYLFRITRNEGKTVIITTHYIEEAKHSDKVCFLKEGKALLEGSPAKLLQKYKTNSLEEIYFKCHWQDLQQPSPEDVTSHTINRSKSHLTAYKDDNGFNFRRVIAFTSKSLMQIRRNPMIFYICVLMPGLLFVLLKEVSRPPSTIQLAYINQEAQCDLDTSLHIPTQPLSCRFLHKLRGNNFYTIEYENVTAGLDAVKRNAVWALLYFSPNFTEGVLSRLEFFASENPGKSLEEPVQIAVWIDMSSYVISEMLKRGLHECYMEALFDYYKDSGWNAHYVQPILKLKGWIHGREHKAEAVNSAAIPGTVILIVYTISLSVGLIFILTEKETGTFLRCKALGLSSLEMLLSELVNSNCVMIPSAVVLVCLMHFYWGQSKGNPLWILLLLLVQINTGIINGLFIALMTRNLTLALLVSTGVANVSAYITGVMWPIEGMPWIGQWLSKLLPISISVKSMQEITSRGANVLDFGVAHGFINSFLWIVLFLILIFLVIKRQNNY